MLGAWESRWDDGDRVDDEDDKEYDDDNKNDFQSELPWWIGGATGDLATFTW